MLRALAGPAGTLLVLDDLHWVGPDAVDLLAALLAAAGAPPLRVIGAYRDSETPARLDEFAADLARASLVRVLPLGPLTDADAGRLLLQLAPEGEQMPAVLPAIVRRAGGVPFFLVSYAEQVSDGGQDGAPLAVPWTVAQVIGQRVAALPGPAKELLSVAAVAGRVVPHTLLAQVTGSDDEQVLEAVEQRLEDRQLAEDGTDGYRFTHDLIRETVENGLSAARRRRLQAASARRWSASRALRRPNRWRSTSRKAARTARRPATWSWPGTRPSSGWPTPPPRSSTPPRPPGSRWPGGPPRWRR